MSQPKITAQKSPYLRLSLRSNMLWKVETGNAEFSSENICLAVAALSTVALRHFILNLFSLFSFHIHTNKY